jgi:SAM-dependent methyltransferase
VLLRATERPVEAEQAYRAAIRIAPDHIDAHTNLGVLLTSLKRNEEAVACFCKALTLRPKHPDARKLLALAHSTIGEVDEAIRIFEAWLIEEPANPIARHMLAACTGLDVPERASNAFVTDTFASFAASFEAKLARLSYRAPALVVAMLADARVAPSRDLDVLDAGCGTGLCGPLLAPYARQLCGMDLSAAMLAHAEAKHVYDELAEGELTEYLGNHSRGVRPDRLRRHARLFREARRRARRCDAGVAAGGVLACRSSMRWAVQRPAAVASSSTVATVIHATTSRSSFAALGLRRRSSRPTSDGIRRASAGLVIRARKRRRVERRAA